MNCMHFQVSNHEFQNVKENTILFESCNLDMVVFSQEYFILYYHADKSNILTGRAHLLSLAMQSPVGDL